MVSMACVRPANRQCLALHPEWDGTLSRALVVAWTPIVAGVISAARHFLWWALVLLGAAGWTSSRLPGRWRGS